MMLFLWDDIHSPGAEALIKLALMGVKTLGTGQ
jgi:hypothetical protein